MENLLFNLQMFGEGGAGAGDGGANSGDAGAQNGGSGATAGEDLSHVVYGVSTEESVADSSDTKTASVSKEDRAKSFDDLIKKGGEYAEEFQARTQKIIDKRFAQAKEMENTLKSHDSVMKALARRYGVDANDTEALLKEINADDEWIEKQAFKEGLTKEQFKEREALREENEAFRIAEQEHAKRQMAEQAYTKWMGEAEALVNKYGLTDFDLARELTEYPQFARLLQEDIDMESAYMAIHRDEVLGSAMAHTARQVEQKVANRVASRQSRPSENGVSSTNTNTFKTDVNMLSNNDIDEVLRRVRGGERISFG